MENRLQIPRERVQEARERRVPGVRDRLDEVGGGLVGHPIERCDRVAIERRDIGVVHGKIADRLRPQIGNARRRRRQWGLSRED